MEIFDYIKDFFLDLHISQAGALAICIIGFILTRKIVIRSLALVLAIISLLAGLYFFTPDIFIAAYEHGAELFDKYIL